MIRNVVKPYFKHPYHWNRTNTSKDVIFFFITFTSDDYHFVFGCYHGYGCWGYLLPDIFHYLMLALLVEEPLKFPLLWNLLVQPHGRKFHGGLETLHLHACVLSCDWSGRLTFWRKLQWSSLWAFEDPQASFYQGRWFRFLHWCHGRNSSQCCSTNIWVLLVSV